MEVLDTIYGSFNVYVNRVVTEEEILLHISFVDKQNKTHIVLLKYILGRWSFDEPQKYPDWVIGLKDEFINLIAKNSIREFRSALN